MNVIESISKPMSFREFLSSIQESETVYTDDNLPDASSFSNWTMLSKENIENEYDIEYKRIKPIFGDVFPTLDDFASAVKSTKPSVLSQSMDSTIDYRTSGIKTMSQLETLVSTYKYPRDVQKIVRGFVNNNPMPHPIILRRGEYLRIMGGNTRLSVAKVLGIKPRVLIIDV